MDDEEKHRIHHHWRTSRMVEDYVSVVSDLIVPHVAYGQYGNDPAKNEYRVERPTLLGAMISPARRPLVFEAWSPCEIATFEGALALHGKKLSHAAAICQDEVDKGNHRILLCMENDYSWKGMEKKNLCLIFQIPSTKNTRCAYISLRLWRQFQYTIHYPNIMSTKNTRCAYISLRLWRQFQ